jgi:predicted DNA binding CopG/RHH family protein
MKKPFPKFKTDKEAEHFVATADLSHYDFSGFKPASFEFEPKTKSVTMRLPESLLNAVRATAEKQGIPYQKLIRRAIETLVSETPPAKRSAK